MSDIAILYSIDNTADYPVVAQTKCARIFVQENYSSTAPPTQDLLQRIPATAQNAVSIPRGTPAIYTALAALNGRFAIGQVVGTIRTAAGAVTIQQIESTQI